MFSKRQIQQAQWAQLAEHGVVYAFVITHVWDSESDRDNPPLKACPAPFEYGPADAEQDLADLALAEGAPWRLIDDDGNPMAKGRMWTSDTGARWWDSEASHQPLYDYGEPMFGATEIQYRDQRKWVSL